MDIEPDGRVFNYCACDDCFFVWREQEEYTEKTVVDQILREENEVFGYCERCGRYAVFPDSWIPICPSCEFIINLG